MKLERETSILQLFRGNSCNEMFHVKHSEIAPRETTRNRFGKAGAHPQLALGIAIAPETLSHIYNLSILKAIAILPIFSQIFVVFHCAVLLFASQMWAARPHLGSIFEKLLHRKTFYLPAAFIFEQFVFIKTLHKNCTCSNETGAMNTS